MALLLLLHSSTPLSPVILKEISPPVKLILPRELFSQALCVECCVLGLWVWRWWISVVWWCSAACMSLYFGLSLKCLWNVVPDQHAGTTGLTSCLISLYDLLDYTFLLCVHFEFLHPDVWWVKMNIILCFNHFLDLKPVTSVFEGRHTCCLLSVNHCGTY